MISGADIVRETESWRVYYIRRVGFSDADDLIGTANLVLWGMAGEIVSLPALACEVLRRAFWSYLRARRESQFLPSDRKRGAWPAYQDWFLCSVLSDAELDAVMDGSRENHNLRYRAIPKLRRRLFGPGKLKLRRALEASA